MKNTFNAIVNPVITKNTPDPGETAVLVSSASDLNPLKQCLDLEGVTTRSLFMSQHYLGECGANRVSLVGPLIGAPYAVMLLDTLVAWGVKQFLFLGWCGSITKQVSIGDVVVPDRAFIDEGTSIHYRETGAVAMRPESDLAHRVVTVLSREGIECHTGAVWTTDAIYRETREQVCRFQDEGALAVEMEMSALFSAARFREVDICGVLVTSDLLCDLQWRPGFRDQAFKAARGAVVRAVSEIVQADRKTDG